MIACTTLPELRFSAVYCTVIFHAHTRPPVARAWEHVTWNLISNVGVAAPTPQHLFSLVLLEPLHIIAAVAPQVLPRSPVFIFCCKCNKLKVSTAPAINNWVSTTASMSSQHQQLDLHTLNPATSQPCAYDDPLQALCCCLTVCRLRCSRKTEGCSGSRPWQIKGQSSK